MRRLVALLAPEGRGAEDGADGDADEAVVAWEDVRFQADFAHDAQGIVTIRLRVEVDLPLLCQRSLLPYAEPVRRDTLLAVVESLAEQELLPEDYEPVLVEDGRLALLDLVEDELLLAVPQVPRNPAIGAIEVSTEADEGGKRPGGEGQSDSKGPFEGLADLLGRDKPR